MCNGNFGFNEPELFFNIIAMFVYKGFVNLSNTEVHLQLKNFVYLWLKQTLAQHVMYATILQLSYLYNVKAAIKSLIM